MPRVQAPDGPIDFPDTMKDTDIEAAMAKLYPQSTTPQSTIAPPPQTTGIFPRIAQWGKDLSTDLREGTDLTAPGRFLHMAGARPLREGVSPQTAEYMGSPELGVSKVIQGLGETGTPGQRLHGMGHVAGGALQTATLPLSIMPETVAGTGPAAVRGFSRLLPSAERSGNSLSEIEAAIGHHPINIEEPGNAALESMTLASRGNPAPAKPIQNFLTRTTAPDRITAGGAEISHPPLTFKEGRDFYSAGRGKLATDEATRLNSKQIRALNEFTHSLGNSLQQTADEYGRGPEYAKAITEYRRAKQLQSGLKTAGKIGAGAAVAGAGVEAGRRLMSPLWSK